MIRSKGLRSPSFHFHGRAAFAAIVVERFECALESWRTGVCRNHKLEKPVALDQKAAVKTKWPASRGPLYVIKSGGWRRRRGVPPCIRRVLDGLDGIHQRSYNVQLGGIHSGDRLPGPDRPTEWEIALMSALAVSPNRVPTECTATHKPNSQRKHHKPKQKPRHSVPHGSRSTFTGTRN